MQLQNRNPITFQFEFLNIQVTVSLDYFNDIVVPPLKLAGVIVTAFEPF